MVRKGGQSSLILKRDVKDAFRNIPLAPHIRWLLAFLGTIFSMLESVYHLVFVMHLIYLIYLRRLCTG